MSAPPIKVAPAARRLASEAGIDLGTLQGSGPAGRVVRADVEHAIAAVQLATQGNDTGEQVSDTSTPTSPKGETTILEPTRAQALIAHRMSSAKANVPEFTVAREVDAGALVALRERLRASDPPAPSLNDLIVAAAAIALREHPSFNGCYLEGRFVLHSRVNIGIAVATERSLLVPTIFDADRRSVCEIAAETRRLVAKARGGGIEPGDLEGGTFTVSNLGGMGVTRFIAVINEPQAAILAVGAVLARAIVTPDGSLRAGQQLELTLTADHRIVYGAQAAAFLETIAGLLEAPDGLLS